MSVWLAWSRMLGKGAGAWGMRRLVLDEDIETGQGQCRNEEDEGSMR